MGECKAACRWEPFILALIPKVDALKGLGDYRPISLIGCLYIIIAKVLAVRLKEVIRSVVEENQLAFVGGRNMLRWGSNSERDCRGS